MQKNIAGARKALPADLLVEYASLKDKTSLLQVIQQIGALSVNDVRQLLGYDAIDGGDVYAIKADYSTNDITNTKEV